MGSAEDKISQANSSEIAEKLRRTVLVIIL